MAQAKSTIEYVGFWEAIDRLSGIEGIWLWDRHGWHTDWDIKYSEIKDLFNRIDWQKDRIMFIPSKLGYSDYVSGGLIYKANYNCFIDIDCDSRSWDERSYGWNGSGIQLDPRFISNEQLEFIESLESYCVADDDELARLQFEAEGEQWEQNYSDDVRKYIISMIDSKLEFMEDDYPNDPIVIKWKSDLLLTDNWVDSKGDKWLYSIFETAREQSNTYWEMDDYVSVSIDIDRILESIDLDEIWDEFMTDN